MHFICVHFTDILYSYFGSIFTEVLLTFYVVYFTEFFLAFFTEKMRRFYKDFYVCCKISVNFGHNLQGKHKGFTNIVCDLDAQNVVKSTYILWGL